MKRITKIEAAKDSGRKKLRVAAYARVSTDSDDQLVHGKSEAKSCHGRLYKTVCRAELSERLSADSCHIILQIGVLKTLDDLLDISLYL